MSHPDEGLIHAWLDGEIDAAEAARVEALVRDDPAWGAAAVEARGLIAASARIIGALDNVPANIVPASNAAKRPVAGGAIPARTKSGAAAAPRRLPWWAARAAAVLVVATGTVVVFTRSSPTPVADAAKIPAPAPSVAAAPESTPSAELAVTAAPLARQKAKDDAGTVGTRATMGATANAPANEADAKARAALSDARVEGRFAASELARRDSVVVSKATSTDERRLVAVDQATAAAGAGAELKKEIGALAGQAAKAGAAGQAATAPPASARAQAVTTFARDECYREAPAAAGGAPVVHHVSRTGDSTAVAAAPQRMRGEENSRLGLQSGLTQVAPAPPLRVRGDTLFARAANGATRVALRITCPAP